MFKVSTPVLKNEAAATPEEKEVGKSMYMPGNIFFIRT